MRALLLMLAGGAGFGLVYVWTARLSDATLAALLGVALGAAALLPVLLIAVLVLARQRAHQDEDRRVQAPPLAYPYQPPVVIIMAADRPTAPTLEAHHARDEWPSARRYLPTQEPRR